MIQIKTMREATDSNCNKKASERAASRRSSDHNRAHHRGLWPHGA
jgi:hypothetical protein